MKKIINIFIILVISLISSFNVAAASNPYGKWQDLYGAKTVRCTWYAWDQAYKHTGVALPNLGNAQDWYDNAKKYGYSVGKTPKAKSIAVWTSTDGYGHVGYVVSVSGDTMVTNEGGLIESEPVYCNGDSGEVCEYKSVAFNGDGIANGATRYTTAPNIIGYIYLTEGKVKTTTKATTKKNSGNDKTTKKTTTTKIATSNNVYLKDLSLDFADFEFDKEKDTYTFEVDYKTRIISIKAIPEETSAIVSGTGDKTLEIGENNFIIKVTSPNASEKTYSITITRKEKDIIKKETLNNNSITYLIIMGIIVAIVLMISIIFILIKKDTNKKNI